LVVSSVILLKPVNSFLQPVFCRIIHTEFTSMYGCGWMDGVYPVSLRRMCVVNFAIILAVIRIVQYTVKMSRGVQQLDV